MKKWRDGNSQKEVTRLKYKKIFAIFMTKNFDDVKDGFVKIRLFSMKKKIESLLLSNSYEFLHKEEKILEEEAKLRMKIATFTFFYTLDRKFQHQKLKFQQLAFYKMFYEAENLKIKQKILKHFMNLLKRKVKKFAFDGIDNFSKRKRILFQIMNSIKVKTLIKSFWALKHWKQHKNDLDDEKNQLKCLFLIEKLRKIENNCKKNILHRIFDHNNKQANMANSMKKLASILNRKVQEAKKEGFLEILDLMKKINPRIRKMQNCFFLAKILFSMFQRKEFKIMKEGFDNLKEIMEERLINKKIIEFYDFI